MLQVDEELKRLYQSDSTDKNLMIEFSHPGQAPFLRLWDNSHILSESMVIEESLSSSENLDFGSCEATQISLTLIDVEQNINGAEMTVYQTLDGIYPEHVPLRVYHAIGEIYCAVNRPAGETTVQGHRGAGLHEPVRRQCDRLV